MSGLIKDHSFVVETVHKYLTFGCPALALSTYNTAHNPTLYLQNLVIRCFSEHGFYHELLGLYGRSRIRSDNFTFPLVIKACAAICSLRAGKEVHCMVLRSGYGGNVGIQTALVDMYAKTGQIEASRKVFDQMPNRDLVSWNAMILGYSSNGFGREAFEAMRGMQLDGFKPNSGTFISIVPICSSSGSLDVGESLHGFALKCGALNDEALLPTLISMYAGFHNLSSARLLFDMQHTKDFVAWNAMLSAYAQNRKSEKALEVLKMMHHEGIRPNLITFVSVLPSCHNLFSIHLSESIHAIVIRLGFADQVSLIAALVSMYAKLGELNSAEYLFHGSPEKNILLLNSMISGYLINKEWSAALYTFHYIHLEGIAPDAVSLVSIVSACKSTKNALLGKSVHAYSTRNGFDSNLNVANALLALYSDCDQISASLKLFQTIKFRNVISWNTIVSGFANIRDAKTSLALFCSMQQEGVRFDLVTLVGLLSGLTHFEDLVNGKSVHSLSIKSGCDSDTSLTNALISMYANCGDIGSSQVLFEDAPIKSIVSYNALMTGYRRNNSFEEVMVLYQQMVMDGQTPNAVTLLNILPICESQVQGKSIHGYAVRNFFTSESTLLTSCINMYARFDNISYCRLLFKMVDETNIVGWNTIISAFAQSNHSEEALTYFRKMLEIELKPDTYTMLALFSACSQLKSMDMAQCLMGFTVRKGLMDSNTSVANSLIDMVARCGSISLAKEIFEGVKEKDSITWSVMINAFGMHGNGEAALDLFHAMKETGLDPDEITFISILSACSHAGLVDHGKMLFNSMLEDHHIVPRMEHYACMVDLFGRTGHLDEAYELVTTLPFKPSSSLLESLLGACHCHGHAEIGEAVGKLLIKSKPFSSSSYVMLSNIYAAAGKWGDNERLRCDMDVKGVYKDAGVSLIKSI